MTLRPVSPQFLFTNLLFLSTFAENCKMSFLRKSVLFVICLSCISAGSFAQKSNKKQAISEEDMKLLQEHMKELDNLPNGSEIKKIAQEAQKRIEQGQKSGMMAASAPEFPKPNAEVVATIPKKTMTSIELKEYVEAIYKKVIEKSSEGEKKEIAKMIDRYKDKATLHQLSVYGWYFAKSPMEAIALMAQACLKDMNDGLMLNNLAALLIIGGAPEKAIPVLRYLVTKHPEDPLVANNMGQAYAALGIKDTAKTHLARAARVSKHPQANNTLAQIAKAEGNTAKAAEYAAASLEGGYSETAMEILEETGMEDKYKGYTGEPELPDYFNEYKFRLPRAQMTIKDYEAVIAEKASFRDKIDAEREKLGPVKDEYEKAGTRQLEQMMKSIMNDPRKMAGMATGRTFAAMTARTMPRRIAYLNHMLEDEQTNQPKYREEQKQLTESYQKKTESIRQGYLERIKKIPCGEGNGKGCVEIDRLRKEMCVKVDEATNEYLADRGTREKNHREKKQRIYLYLFYEYSRAGFLSAPNEAMGNAAFYGAAAQYVSRIRELIPPEPVSSSCIPVGHVPDTMSLAAKWNFKCPVNIDLPFIVGKVNVNCESITIKGGEGALFSFSQNFRTKQSTLSIGIGLDLEGKKGDLGFVGNIKLKLSQTFYITHDGKTGIYDMGMKFGAGLSAGYTVPPALSKTGVMDNGSASGEVGWRFGINSGMEPGIEFNEGPFKGVFTPAPVQVNPNIGIYPK